MTAGPAYFHLFATINTDSQAMTSFRILDVGCGSGTMIEFFRKRFSDVRPGAKVDVCGMDVRNVGFESEKNFFGEGIAVIGNDTEPWPYSDSSFDFVVSNQVFEHVRDQDLFFSELARVLKKGGVSYHLFPLNNCLWEGHVKAPIAHQIIDHDRQWRWIRWMQRVGLGRDIDPFDAADSLLKYTFYRPKRDVLLAVKRAGLRPSLRHTTGFYTAKLRKMIGLSPRDAYRRSHSWWLTSKLLSYVSCVTLRAEKP